MTHLAVATLIAITLLTTPALAQHRPYAGEAARDIKALSTEEIEQHRPSRP